MSGLVHNNRKHPRISVDLALKCKDFLLAKETPMEVLAKNLSLGGMSFYLDHFTAMSHKLILEFDLPLVAHNVRTIFKIMWIHKSPTDEQFLVGGKFLEMSKENKTQIAEFVYDRIKDQFETLREQAQIA
ncbi:MAG: PilZ domain-containing protein [Candidatus Omnitrophica bacterium]|nr:PilZ domain-containing protein [Candidatus Omnitrophota bacterium]